ncbi:MAG: AmmeMemoRadiSam system protein B [Terriglobales bacterium]
MSTHIRQPAVAGSFYPGDPEKLRHEIQQYVAVTGDKIHAIGCVVPHAGYMYSGHVAGAVYARLDLPRRFVILCPNHTGIGEPLAIMSEGSWRTPLGNVSIDTALAQDLMSRFPLLAEDELAHRAEHALEVQLPFLQELLGTFTFVPITVGTSRPDALTALGIVIADALKDDAERAMIIASSDMNHYEPDAPTRVKDRKAIDKMLALDAKGLYDTVVGENISMCGFGPAVAMLTAAKRLGAKSAQLVKYATSGDISGDRDTVVGYAGIAVGP